MIFVRNLNGLHAREHSRDRIRRVRVADKVVLCECTYDCNYTRVHAAYIYMYTFLYTPSNRTIDKIRHAQYFPEGQSGRSARAETRPLIKPLEVLSSPPYGGDNDRSYIPAAMKNGRECRLRCVSKRSPEDLRGWEIQPALPARAARYTRRECGICRNRKACHRLHINEHAHHRARGAGRRTKGCALIVAHFQAVAFQETDTPVYVRARARTRAFYTSA